MKKIVIVAAKRTPIGKFGGALASLSAAELGGQVAKNVVSSSSVDANAIDQVIFGHARQAGGGPNTARQIVKLAGLSDDVPAYTVNQACASGLRAIISAAQAITTGESNIVLAGGTESMSNTPYLLPKARWGYRFGHDEVVDGMYRDGFFCPLCKMLMGETAEKLIEKEGISREEQDDFALKSQQKWAEAEKRGRWDNEIAPVEVRSKKSITIVEKDEHPRAGTSLEKLIKLRPTFKKDGSVHPGNASGITDGAAACLVMSMETAEKHKLSPMAYLKGYVSVGVDPSIMGIGPVPAVQALLEKTEHTLPEIGLFEINEAFAGQALACMQKLEIDPSKVNVNGGAIALGHPIGATGARIVTTLLHDMADRNERLGIATLCVSGGMGVAALMERVDSYIHS